MEEVALGLVGAAAALYSQHGKKSGDSSSSGGGGGSQRTTAANTLLSQCSSLGEGRTEVKILRLKGGNCMERLSALLVRIDI
jgi:hypothetical protein